MKRLHRRPSPLVPTLVGAFLLATVDLPAQSLPLTRTNPPPRTTAVTNLPTRTATGTGTPASTNRPASTRFRPITKPAPTVRLTGGSRGTGDQLVQLDVLAPPDVGFTTQDQPSLFWFQSRPSNARLELAILRDNQPEPVFHQAFESAAQAGIQRLDLKSTPVRLLPNVEYQWVVALVTDPDNRSSDLVASGFIQRTEPTPDARRRIDQADASSRPQALAESGFWYDALAGFSDRLEADATNSDLRTARATLLRQAGLNAAAQASSSASPAK